MAHILSVDEDATAVTAIHTVLRALGHTVDQAFDGEEGIRLARLHPYDVVVANPSMPRMHGNQMLDAVPRRPSGLPVCVLQTDGRVNSVGPGRFDFAVYDSARRERVLSTVQVAIELAGTRAKAHEARSVPPPTERAYRAPEWAHGTRWPAIDPASAARRQAAEEELRRTVRLNGASPREVRWFHGPRAACRHLLEEYPGSTFVARRDVPPLESGGPFPDPLGRFNPSVDLRFLGLAPTWAAIERRALGRCFGSPGAELDPSLEALLALAYRGIGSVERRWGATRLWGEELLPPGPVGLHQIWWWILEDGNVVAADPPRDLALDRGGAPHSTTGPAIQYLDGFDVYALHGRAVDAEIIQHPERIALDAVRACTDAEVRRALRHLYGDVRYLTDTGAKLIHMDTVPVDALAPGSASLTRALLEDDEGLRFLVASDGSTSRVYHMRVPRSCTTCAEAYTALSGHPGVKTILEA